MRTRQEKNEYATKYRRSKIGKIRHLYTSQIHNSKVRNHSLPNYSYEELFIWITTKTNFNQLYDDWAKADFNKQLSPSCDRLDDFKPYTLNNLRMVTWKENKTKQNTDKKLGKTTGLKPVLQLSKAGNCMTIYFSIAEAGRQTKIRSDSIVAVCKGHRNSAGGFHWQYA